MKREEIEKKVTDMIIPYLDDNEYELVDVEYVKEGPEYFLRLYIDKEGGITISECASVSRLMSKLLDEDDFIEGEYRLQVSSPGLDRTLKKDKDFERYANRIVELKTYEKIGNQKEFEGQLITGIGDKITINVDGKVMTFDKEKVSSIKLKVIL